MAGRIDLANLPFRIFAALFVALAVLVCAPLLLTPLPPLVDYPNHLARMYLLANLDHTPALQPYYAVTWRPVPDLAMDIVVPPLLRFLPLAEAGKLFLALTYLVLAGGTVALNRTLSGRWSVWPCLAFLLIYNRLLLWGFLNFLFGLGLALCGFALWIAWRERGMASRFAVGVIMALAIYFSHLMAYGIYGALIVGYEAGLAWESRKSTNVSLRGILLAILSLLPPVYFFVVDFIGAHVSQLTVEMPRVIFSNPLRKFDLLFSVFDIYSRPIDVACFALVVIVMAYGYWRRWFRLVPQIVAPLILLAIIYVLLPTTLLTANGADRRLPLAMALVLIGGTTWQAALPRLRRAFFGGAAALFAFRLTMVALSWQNSGRLYTDIIGGFDALPHGARLAVAYPSNEVNVEATPMLHLPVLAVARRGVFVSTLFAYASQQPISLTSAWSVPDRAGASVAYSSDNLWRHFVGDGAPLDPDTAKVLNRYDYVSFAGRSSFTLRPDAGLTPVFLSPRFQIYQLPARSS